MSTKRLFSLILAVAMLAAIVAGCTNQNGAPISSPPVEETAAPVPVSYTHLTLPTIA